MLPKIMKNDKKNPLSSKAQHASSTVNSSQNRCFAVGQPSAKFFKTCTKNRSNIDGKSLKKWSQKPTQNRIRKKSHFFVKNVSPRVPQGLQNRAQILPQTLLGPPWGHIGTPGSPKALTGEPKRPPDPKNRLKSLKMIPKSSPKPPKI